MGLKAVKGQEEKNSACRSLFKMETQQQWVLSGIGAGIGFSRDFHSGLEKGLNHETSKSIDDTNLSRVVKCHAGDGEWGRSGDVPVWDIQKDPTKPGGQIGFRVGGHQEWY